MMMSGRSGWLAVALLAVVFYVILCLGTFTKTGPASDYFVHLAAIRTLAEGGDVGDIPLARSRQVLQRHNDPHHRSWAMVMRHTHLAGSDVMAIAGVFNLAVFVAGLAFLSRCFSQRWTMLACLLVVMLFMWGKGYRYSGEYSFSNLPVVASYPSTLAWGLSFFVCGLVMSWTQRGGLARLAGAAVIGALVVTVHGLTALAFTLTFPVLWCWTARASWGRRLMVCVFPLGALLLSMLWPGNSIISQIFIVSQWNAATGSNVMSMTDKAWHFLNPLNSLQALGPALWGFAFLMIVPHRWRRQLIAGAVTYGLIWVGASIARIPLAHRFVFPLVFVLHLAIATGLERLFRTYLKYRKTETGQCVVPRAGVVVVLFVMLVPWGAYHMYHVLHKIRKRVALRTLTVPSSYLWRYEKACEDIRKSLPATARILTDPVTAVSAPAFGLPVVPGGGLEQNNSPEVIHSDFIVSVQRAAEKVGGTHFLVNRTVLSPLEQENVKRLGIIKWRSRDLSPGFCLVEIRRLARTQNPGSAGERNRELEGN